MRKYLVVCAAMTLLCSLVRAQEAEDAGSGAVLSIIPRLDAGIIYGALDGDEEALIPTFGNTSLYTLFEGTFAGNWSFSMANHWYGVDPWGENAKGVFLTPAADLYHFNVPGLGNNAYNFLDWAYITWAPAPFEFTLGKQVTLMGGFEFDDYDFDVNPLLASDIWNGYNCYNWGITAAWHTLKETSTVSFQVSTNPLNNGISFGAGWNGEYGPYSMKWSALTYSIPGAEKPWDVLVCLGNRLTFGNFQITADWFNHCADPLFISDDERYSAYHYSYPLTKGNTVIGSVLYSHGSGKFDIGAKAVWNGVDTTAPYGYVKDDSGVLIPTPVPGIGAEYGDLPSVRAGLWGSWYPLKGSQALRIQAAAGLSNYFYVNEGGSVFATLGATWNFEIPLWGN